MLRQTAPAATGGNSDVSAQLLVSGRLVGGLDDGRLLARTILNEPLVLYRNVAGEVVTLADRCPHRFAPLSAGRVEGVSLVCGYHGVGFGADGRCTVNPHGPINPNIRVASYPTAERHLAIWVWLGEAQMADPATIPNLSFIDETLEAARIRMYMPTAANYTLIVDNVMDLSHADFLHPTTLGGIMAGVKARTDIQDDRIAASWDSPDCVAPPAFRPMLGGQHRGDIWTEVTWRAPAVMVLGVAATRVGSERTAADESYTLHNVTPETGTTSHYFVCNTRKMMVEDAAFTRHIGIALSSAFQTEDKPMLEKQQQRMGTTDLFSLHPTLLPIDHAAVRVRRRLESLVAEELTRA